MTVPSTRAAATAARNPIAFLPIVGSPPTLEWMPVSELSVDPTYQRSMEGGASRELVERIARGWDWRLFQPLSVARREDGRAVIVDGQHRHAGAKLRGDIPHLPCIITRFGNVAAEAEAFVKLNANRKKLSALELFRAAIAGGSRPALDIERVIEGAGLSLAPHSNFTAWKPGMISCIGGVKRAYARHGRAIVAQGLAALAEAYPDEVLRYAGSILPGLYLVFARPETERAGFDRDLFIAILGGTTQAEWLTDAQRRSSASRISETAMRDALLAAYQEATADD